MARTYSLVSLHHAALEETRRLLGAGAHAVAVTGSVGRGNPSKDSDVDLWVLWDRNQRRHFQRGNVWVTDLIQTPEEAFSLDNLCLWDVEDLWVVADPDGLFAAIKRRYREHRKAIHREIVASTVDALIFHAQRTMFGTAWHRLQHLHELAWRAASLWAFEQHGWRVPKARQLRTILPAPAARVLGPALGLPLSPSSRRSLAAAWPRAARMLLPSWRPKVSAPQPLQAPGPLARRFSTSQDWDAVVTVRRLLALDLLPHALAEANVWDPYELPAWPVASVFAAAHGVPRDPNALAPAHATARAVAALCRALGTGRHVPRRVGFDAALKHATRAR